MEFQKLRLVNLVYSTSIILTFCVVVGAYELDDSDTEFEEKLTSFELSYFQLQDGAHGIPRFSQ